ncbi:hypothetical protein Glove_296g72 [Diversispora epigaea]|uniref:Zinc-ribbon domain-containing protein n=1 Tax=Diversispora epigaea TaxID=1348612 RepID=A0A397HZK6_9GLOM|nr:hypothetical protein Glove_296g72 [Diversispora epigaea]
MVNGPYYADNRLTLEEIAYNKEGKCLSNQYINNITPLLWQCNKSHIWYASLGSIKNRNTWCSQCAKCGLTRNILGMYPLMISEIAILGLQLDIYYPEYGFVIEVQGVQYEKYIKFFYRGDPNNFIKQRARDQLKKELYE